MFHHLYFLAAASVCAHAHFILKTVQDPNQRVYPSIITSDVGFYPLPNKDGATVYIHEYVLISGPVPKGETRTDTFLEDATHFVQSVAPRSSSYQDKPEYVVTECNWASDEAKMGRCKQEAQVFAEGTGEPPLTSPLTSWSGTILPWSTLISSGTSTIKPTQDPFVRNNARRMGVNVVHTGILLAACILYLL
ncbi:hypothetical protein BDN72DRAFT_843391 [Pluteus cervinus]|uniref:Uncharacterized protein n=1 Tax=Pluteus cervinus TaxID=181527 RepID=A0ACD3ANY3_9AGAR|nr:hypothetical protein BDN72DRAFT_843391 [Pluteus cervinus]